MFSGQPRPLLPGQAEHLALGQLAGDHTGRHQAGNHGRNHQIVKVVLEQVEALAGGDPRAVQVQPVDKHQAGGLQARGRGHNAYIHGQISIRKVTEEFERLGVHNI